MKKLTSILLITCLTTLSSAICRAESVAITHEFDAMKGTTLTWGTPSNYTIGYTDLVTYTGSGGGKFGADAAVRICIELPEGGVMQLSPAVADIVRLQLMKSSGGLLKNIEIYISTDNSTWTNVSSYAEYHTSDIDLEFPEKGNYYIKVVNTGAKIWFNAFKYYTEPCHCLRVVVN